MGTAHGLSKYPIYGKDAASLDDRWGQPQGFTVWEIDISRRLQRRLLPPDLPEIYRRLKTVLGWKQQRYCRYQVSGGNNAPHALYDLPSVGIGHYAIDFHPCMTLNPPELPGNTERPGERRGGMAFPFQILRAMIPQKVDNLLVASKVLPPVILQQLLIECIRLNGQLGQELVLQLLLLWRKRSHH